MNEGKETGGRHPRGPSISAVPFRHSGTGLATPLLSEAERGRLALIATVVHFGTGDVLFMQGDELTSIYNISHGVARTYSSASDGRRTLLAFLFAEDLLGLAENGRYVVTAEAVTPVTAYRLPVAALERLLRQDPELEIHFLCKVCHELREAQRHAILLARKDAGGKVALFLASAPEPARRPGRGGAVDYSNGPGGHRGLRRIVRRGRESRIPNARAERHRPVSEFAGHREPRQETLRRADRGREAWSQLI